MRPPDPTSERIPLTIDHAEEGGHLQVASSPMRMVASRGSSTAPRQNGGMSASAPITTSVSSRDGTRIGVMKFGRTPQAAPAPTLVFLPALGVPLGYYSGMLEHWSHTGRHIVAVEQRGMPLTPTSGIRHQRFGYSTIVRDDLPAVIDSLLPDSHNYMLVGHSLGGQLALLATAAGTVTPEAVVAIASGTSSPTAKSTRLGHVSRRGQVAFIRAVSAALGFWPGHRLGFGGRQPRSLMRDWCYEGVYGRYRLDGDDTKYESALRGIRQPVLLLSLEGDPIITQPAAAHLARRLPAHSEHRRLTSTRAKAFDHIRWA